jgi:phosphate acetyltransferase
MKKYKRLEQFDFVLVEGTSFSGKELLSDLYRCFSTQKFGYSTIIDGRSAVGKTLEELIDSIYLAYDSFKVKG